MTESDWQLLLDDKPDDRDLRRIYADWLEDQGREREARLQRWLGETGRRPLSGRATTRRKPDGTLYFTAPHVGYGWASLLTHGDHWQIPGPAYVALMATAGKAWPYDSRAAAEQSLLQPGVFEALFAQGGDG